jgi:hypothetical protein
MGKLASSSFIKGGVLVTASIGDFVGKTRIEIVFEKIDKGLPFILGKDENGTKVYGKSFTSKEGGKPNVNNYPYNLTYSKSKTSKKSSDFETESITKFFKDKDFGGGKGSGGGDAMTKIVESGQAYYTSYIFNVEKKKFTVETKYTAKNWSKAVSFVDATTSYSEFKKTGPDNWLEEDKNGLNIYEKTANAIYDMYGKKLKTPVYCHRDSDFMKNIYAAKKVAFAFDQKNDKLAPGSFRDDKWNPGDIWISSLSQDADPLKNCLTFSELQKCILNAAGQGEKPYKIDDTTYDDTILLGISLKKVEGDTAKVTEYNKWTNPKNRQHNKTGSVVYKGYTFGKKGDFFSSNDVYLDLGQAQIQLRASNTTTSWQGLLIGASAYAGKCGGGNLQYYMNKLGRSITYNGKKTNDWKETLVNKVDDKKFFNLYKKYINTQSDKSFNKQTVLSETAFAAKVKSTSNPPAFKFQKNMSLMLIDQLNELKPASKRNEFVTEIVRYAASNTDQSTYFIKVEG